MNNIRIVRLKSGEDIIGNICDENGMIQVDSPMSVSLVTKNGTKGLLVMNHWLPIQLIKKNEIKISSNDVLTTFEPTDELSEYYSDTVKKLASLLEAKELVDQMRDEDIQEIMDALEEGTGETIH